MILKKGTIVDSTIISAPSSTKNKEKQRDPDAHQVKKGNTWHFGYKAHIGVDKDSGIVHTVKVTAANQHDVSMTSELLTGEETVDYMIQDDDSIKYDIFSNSMGTATRESGEFLRNDILNILTRTNAGIILDFAGVKTVSSSFVDELIAKLVLRLGIIKFNQLIRMINMNDDVKFLCERSIYMRIYEAWRALQ